MRPCLPPELADAKEQANDRLNTAIDRLMDVLGRKHSPRDPLEVALRGLIDADARVVRQIKRKDR